MLSLLGLVPVIVMATIGTIWSLIANSRDHRARLEQDRRERERLESARRERDEQIASLRAVAGDSPWLTWTPREALGSPPARRIRRDDDESVPTLPLR